MVSVCLLSDALLQHLPSYLGFSYLGRGVSPHHRPSWPWMWSSSSRPSCARAATAPWTWGFSSRHHPWPRALGSSSWLPPLGHGVLPASAPDLGGGVAPLGRTLCTIAAAHTCDMQWRKWQPTPVLLPGKSHGRRRSLEGCSPWGR